MNTNDLNQILTERGTRYGKFVTHARISQSLKRVIADQLEARPLLLTADQQEALEMICHKIARIINGDPDYAENYRDISGYAMLAADLLSDTEGATDAKVVRMKRTQGGWVES